MAELMLSMPVSEKILNIPGSFFFLPLGHNSHLRSLPCSAHHPGKARGLKFQMDKEAIVEVDFQPQPLKLMP